MIQTKLLIILSHQKILLPVNMKKCADFGQFISDKRMLRSVTCQQLAKRIGISTGYLSQLERGIRLNPDPRLLLKIAQALDLSFEESITLFDLYAEASGQLPPDITEYLTGNSVVQQVIRQARATNATEEDWEHFIEQLKK